MSWSYCRVLILLFAVTLSAFQWDEFRKRDKAGGSTGRSKCAPEQTHSTLLTTNRFSLRQIIYISICKVKNALTR